MSENTVLVLIQNGVSSWGIGVVLDRLLEVVVALDNLDKKVEKLLNAPFETAQRALRLAQVHNFNGEINEYNAELERARIKFDDAASRSEGFSKVHAFYLAGLCCDLRQEQTKKFFYYGEAVKAIDSFVSDKSIEKNQHVIAASFIGGAAGFIGGYVGTIYGLMMIFGYWIVTWPLMLPAVITAGVVTAGSGGAAIGKLADKLKGNVKNKKFKALDFTISELRNALSSGKAVNNNIIAARA